MFLRNYLAADEKGKEILPAHTIAAIAIPSRAKEQELSGEPGVWKCHCAGTREN